MPGLHVLLLWNYNNNSIFVCGVLGGQFAVGRSLAPTRMMLARASPIRGLACGV